MNEKSCDGGMTEYEVGGRLETIAAPGLMLSQPNNPFEKIPALAARLGVKPSNGAARASWWINMENGDSYDVFDLINAFLDRLEA